MYNDDSSAAASGSRLRGRHGRAALAIATFLLGCLAASAVWAMSDQGGSAAVETQTPTPVVEASGPGSDPFVNADAAEHWAEAERRERCRTLGSVDAMERCLDYRPPGTP